MANSSTAPSDAEDFISAAGAAPSGADQLDVRGEWKAGWRVVLAAAIGTSTGMLLFTYISSIFIQHYEAAFGWSRGQIALAMGGQLLGAFCAPLIGRLVDRIGVRRVLLVATLGYAATCVAMALQTGSLALFYGLSFVLVAFGVATGSLSWARVISGAFNRSRGLALSTGISAISLTAAIMPTALYFVISTNSWRMGWVFMGAVGLGFGLLALAILPRSVVEAAPRAQPVGDLRDAARQADFWWLLGGILLMNVAAGGIVTQMDALLDDKIAGGVGTPLIMSVFAIAVFFGRFGAGLSVDRFAANRVACAMGVLPAIGFVMLLGDSPALAIVVVGIVLAGLNQGAEGDVAPYIVSSRFGMAAFSRILGSLHGAMAIGTGIGAGVFGFTYDIFGSYDHALVIGAGAFVAGALMILKVGGLQRSEPAPAARVPG
jgi:predicted MFS family arabinose efflux permease